MTSPKKSAPSVAVKATSQARNTQSQDLSWTDVVDVINVSLLFSCRTDGWIEFVGEQGR